MVTLRATGAGALTATLLTALVACGDPDADQEQQHLHPTPDPDATAPSPGPPPEPTIGTWTDLADLPQRRTEIGAAALDGLVYVAGGFIPHEELVSELFTYDPDTDTWSEGAPMPEPRHHAPMVAHDGHVYFTGGYVTTGFGSTSDTLMVYNVAEDSWSEGPPMPEPRGAHAAAVTDDGVIHVMGGVDGATHDDHFAFDIATGT